MGMNNEAGASAQTKREISIGDQATKQSIMLLHKPLELIELNGVM